MRIHHALLKSSVLMALLFLGATGSCFARCNILAEVATGTPDGKVHLATNGVAAFALSTTNEGAACTISVFPVETVNGAVSSQSNIIATLCQTNPRNAVCINPVSPSSEVDLNFAAGEQPTFSVFLRATGTVASQAAVCVSFFEEPTGNQVQPSVGEDGHICVPVVAD
jgi:uncharacterized protein (UPF0333 family)